MTTLAILLLCAALAHTLARLVAIPAVPVLILFGFLASSFSLLPHVEETRQILILGLTFLVFVAGTELSPHRVFAHKKGALIAGVTQFVVLAGLGYAVSLWLLGDSKSALYLGAAVGASSTLVVVRLLQQRRQFYEPFGRFVLGILLVQDVLIILAIAALTSYDGTFSSMIIPLGGVVGLFLLSLLFQRAIIPRVLLSRELDEETLLITALAFVFFFIGVSYFFDIHFIAGAFCAGFALAGFPVRGVIEAQFSSLADFFIALFFVALGSSLILPGGEKLLLACAIIALVLVVTPPLVALLAERAGISSRRAIESGLLLAQTSEFSIIVALVGLQSGHLSNELYGLIAFITVMTMALTPFIANGDVAWRFTKWRPTRAWASMLAKKQYHIVMLGCGRTGLAFLYRISPLKYPVLVIDEDAVALEHAVNCGADVFRGDAADFRVLSQCDATGADMVLSNLRDPRDNENIARFLSIDTYFVRVFEEDDAERIAIAGGNPVLYSILAAEDCIAWYEEHFSR